MRNALLCRTTGLFEREVPSPSLCLSGSDERSNETSPGCNLAACLLFRYYTVLACLNKPKTQAFSSVTGQRLSKSGAG